MNKKNTALAYWGLGILLVPAFLLVAGAKADTTDTSSQASELYTNRESLQKLAKTYPDSNFKIISTVEITQAALTQNEDGNYKVDFEIMNEEWVQPDIVYQLELRNQPYNNYQIVYDRKVFPEKAQLAEQERLNKSVNYTAPDIFSGPAELWLVVDSSQGLKLAEKKVGDVDLSRDSSLDTSSLFIAPSSCYLELVSLEKKEKYLPNAGIVLEKGDLINQTCLITNYFDKEVEVKPIFDVYEESYFGKKIKTTDSSEKLKLAPGQSRWVYFTLPMPEIPGLYFASMRVADTSNADVSSNQSEFQYALGGKKLLIQNIRINKSGFIQGENMKLSLLVYPFSNYLDEEQTGDDPSFAIQAEIKDADGKACAPATKKDITADNHVVDLETTATNDCENPQISITASDQKNNIDTSAQYQIKTSQTLLSSNKSIKTIPLIVYIGVGVLLLIIIVIIIIMINRNKKYVIEKNPGASESEEKKPQEKIESNNSNNKFLIFLLMLSTSLFFGATSAKAGVVDLGDYPILSAIAETAQTVDLTNYPVLSAVADTAQNFVSSTTTTAATTALPDSFVLPDQTLSTGIAATGESFTDTSSSTGIDFFPALPDSSTSDIALSRSTIFDNVLNNIANALASGLPVVSNLPNLNLADIGQNIKDLLIEKNIVFDGSRITNLIDNPPIDGSRVDLPIIDKIIAGRDKAINDLNNKILACDLLNPQVICPIAAESSSLIDCGGCGGFTSGSVTPAPDYNPVTPPPADSGGLKCNLVAEKITIESCNPKAVDDLLVANINGTTLRVDQSHPIAYALDCGEEKNIQDKQILIGTLNNKTSSVIKNCGYTSPETGKEKIITAVFSASNLLAITDISQLEECQESIRITIKCSGKSTPDNPPSGPPSDPNTNPDTDPGNETQTKLIQGEVTP